MTKLKPGDKEKIYWLRTNGKSFQDLSKRFGVSAGYLRILCMEVGVQAPLLHQITAPLSPKALEDLQFMAFEKKVKRERLAAELIMKGLREYREQNYAACVREQLCTIRSK